LLNNYFGIVGKNEPIKNQGDQDKV
jgi:hypothetical protein